MKEYLEIKPNGVTVIHWHKVQSKECTRLQYQRFYKYLKKNCYQVQIGKGEKTKAFPWFVEKGVNWRHDIGKGNNKKYHILYIKRANNTLIKYWWREHGNKDRRTESMGWIGFNEINNKLKQQYGVTLRKAFGCIDGLKIRNRISQMQMSYPYYINDFNIGKTFEHVYKADVSFAFPSQLTKTLPDFHEAKKIYGYAEPTEEYPFAFYLDTHHIKIYGELDTRLIEKDNLYQNFLIYQKKYSSNVTHKFNDCEEKYTILMKASKYSLKDIIQSYYNSRSDDPKAKNKVNHFVGYLRSDENVQNYMGHITAIVYARHWKRMSDYWNKVNNGWNTVMQIQVDCIIWNGIPVNCTCKEKYLGCFHSELEDAKFRMKGVGLYAWDNKHGKIGFRHQSYKLSKDISFSKVEDIDRLGEIQMLSTNEGETYETVIQK